MIREEEEKKMIGLLDQQLKLTKERLNLALSAGNLAWWELDLKTGKVTYNENKIKMLGYSQEEFPKNPHYSRFVDLIHPDEREIAMKAMEDHIKGIKELYEVEYRIRTRKGDYVWFYDRGSVTAKDGEGKPIQVKGVVFDDTERKESQLELEKLNRAKNQFISIMAHDLKNSINGILGISDLLNNFYEKNTEEENIEFIRLVYETAKHTSDMLSDLLEWGRSQTQRLDTRPQSFNLFNTVKTVVYELDSLAMNKKIRVSINGDNPVKCFAHEMMIKTVLRNLLTNAIKFSYKEGLIQINLNKGKLFAEVEIKDQGIGIAEERLKKLFDLSALESTKGTDGEKGTGLGLTLCFEYVSRNEGKIWASSKLGEGSSFFFSLPLWIDKKK